MDLRTLEYFTVVADEKNVTRAAEILHISQPTLSRQMMQLEDEFGVELLERGNKSVSLTQAGKILQARSKELLALYEKTKNEVLNESKRIKGDIFIGVPEIDSFHRIAKKIHAFGELYPDIHFHIISEHPNEIHSKMEQGLLDMAIVVGQVKGDRYGQKKLITPKERVGLLVPADHTLTTKSYVTEEDMLRYRIICPDLLMEKDRLANLFTNTDDINIIATYDLIGNAITMVSEKVGVAISIDRKNLKAKGIKFLPFKPEICLDDSYLVWKKNRVFSKPAIYFLEHVCGRKDIL